MSYIIIDPKNEMKTYFTGYDRDGNFNPNIINYTKEELDNEEWRCVNTIPRKFEKYINDHEKLLYNLNDLYISNLGRVAILRHDNELTLKHAIITKDVRYRHIWYKYKIYKIHRLVALLFIENDNPEEKTQVNHINEFEKYNEKASNLEWCTLKYNINYGSRNTRSSKSLSARKNEIGIKNVNENRYSRTVKLVRIDINTDERKIYNSIKEAQEDNNIERNILYHCYHDGRIFNNQYKFEYLNEYDKNYKEKIVQIEPIFQLDHNLKIIKIYMTTDDLRNDNLNITKILNQCKRTDIIGSHDGYKWMFLSKYSEYLKSCNLPEYEINVNIIIYTKDGKFVKYYSDVKDLLNDGYNLLRVLRCCNGTSNQAGKLNRCAKFLDDFLLMKNITSLDQLNENDFFDELKSERVKKRG